MPNSSHPLERPVGGKGDRDIRKNPKKYRESLFWKKSECCKGHVKINGSNNDKPYVCCECNEPCTLDPES